MYCTSNLLYMPMNILINCACTHFKNRFFFKKTVLDSSSHRYWSSTTSTFPGRHTILILYFKLLSITTSKFRDLYVNQGSVSQPLKTGALLLCPCLFRPSDNVWRSRRSDVPRCMQFSTVISPSWITEQISVGKCAQRGASASQERQTSLKIVTWTKQTWTKHHNTVNFRCNWKFCPIISRLLY